MSISVEQLSVQLGDRQVLQGLDLQLQRGRVMAVVGPNGSGKSTLVKAIAGQVSPSAGRIVFNGSLQRPRSIAYMPQDLAAPMALRVLEVVLLGRLGQLRLRVSPQDLQAVRQVLAAVGIESLAQRYLSELSGGQRQLVFLAQALVSEPTALLLDEPTSALDIAHQLEVLQLVRALTRERQLCTLVVLHDLNAAVRFADEVALVYQGSVCASGAASDVLTESNIGKAFHVRMEVLADKEGAPVLVAKAAWPHSPVGQSALAFPPSP